MAYNPGDMVVAILSLCPGLRNTVDFEVADLGDGNGPFLAHWYNKSVAQPTKAQIEAVDTDALIAAQATVLPQDIVAQLTADDMTKIQAAISSDATKALLWYAMVAQRDPMVVGNARFRAGWAALLSVLGQDRLNAIAAALGVTVH